MGGVGCRCSSEPTEAPPGAALEGKAPDCVRQSALLSLSPSGTEREPSTNVLDPNVELPVAAEPGMAVALLGGFFATGLRHESRGAVALVGRVGADDAPSLLVEIGRVRGDVPPPRLAADGGDLWLVLQDGTPRGRELRVARIAGGDLRLAPSWRPGPEQINVESSSFDIAAQDGAALLVYDDWSANDGHGRILAAPLAAAPEPGRIAGLPVSPLGIDAEAPRISARPGGYWLAWLVNGTSGASGRTSGRVYDPGDDVSGSGAGAAYGPRWLQLVALDGRGKVIGEPRRLTARQGRVVGYDMTTGPSGSAWVVWRQDAPTPGASGGRIAMAEVRVEQSSIIHPLRDEDVGAGEPTWLSAAAGGARWLSFPDARDQTVLLWVQGAGVTSAPLRLGPELGGAGPLAAIGERLLFAVPRGRAIEWSPALCTVSARLGAFADAGAANLGGGDAGAQTGADAL
jgi:hypothetical protein